MSAHRSDDSDPVEVALAVGLRAVAESMARALPADLPALADRMASLARELEARRLARCNVVALDAERERRNKR